MGPAPLWLLGDEPTAFAARVSQGDGPKPASHQLNLLSTTPGAEPAVAAVGVLGDEDAPAFTSFGQRQAQSSINLLAKPTATQEASQGGSPWWGKYNKGFDGFPVRADAETRLFPTPASPFPVPYVSSPLPFPAGLPAPHGFPVPRPSPFPVACRGPPRATSGLSGRPGDPVIVLTGRAGNGEAVGSGEASGEGERGTYIDR